MMAFSSVSVVVSSLLLRAYVKPMIDEDGSLEERGCASCATGCVTFCYNCLFHNPLAYCRLDTSQHSRRHNKDWYGYPLENEVQLAEQRSVV
mmetsp:Transcript_41176/g.70472  ORF Transcript_41176/g.70472 Transcript_41176/m.70472 type:complete len:92 (-) Transcript_41176:158-433(-)